MSAERTRGGGGISLAGLLGVLFIGLKLAHVINWPWWMVLAPFWAGAAGLLVVLLVILAGAIVAASVSALAKH